VKKITLSVLSFLLFLSVNGQSKHLEISQLGIFNSEDAGQSKIYFNLDNQLNEITIGKTQTTREHEVWSVRIYMGSGKNARAIADSKIGSFRSKYPDVEPRLLYPNPDFKVLVGNFKTRIEAESFRRKILGDFPNSRIESVVNSKDN
jgi:hypothetical protein